MFQPKARRVVPVLALTAALSLLPLAADASTARARRATSKPAGISLLAQLEAQLASLWVAVGSIWADSGVRWDDNG